MVAESLTLFGTIRARLIRNPFYYIDAGEGHSQLARLLEQEVSEYFLNQDEELQRYREALQDIRNTLVNPLAEGSRALRVMSIVDTALANEGDN